MLHTTPSETTYTLSNNKAPTLDPTIIHGLHEPIEKEVERIVALHLPAISFSQIINLAC